MIRGKQVFAWNNGDIKKQEVVYSHQGSTKHWCIVNGRLHAFDHVSDLPPEQITRLAAQKLIFELTGEKKIII